MAEEKSLAPGELLLAIESGSKFLNMQAKGLVTRIAAFENWINKIPGRIETTISLDAGHQGELEFLIRLHRSGKSWILSTAYYHVHFDAEDEPDWQPAKEASIETQITVLRELPKLLLKMAETQRSTTKRIGEAQADFDLFARAIGIAEGVG